MYYDTNLARINKNIYRADLNFIRLLRSVFTILLIGRSPVGTSAYSRKRL